MGEGERNKQKEENKLPVKTLEETKGGGLLIFPAFMICIHPQNARCQGLTMSDTAIATKRKRQKCKRHNDETTMDQKGLRL